MPVGADRLVPLHHLTREARESLWEVAGRGYPGHSNPAMAEVVNRSLVPQMFARVATGSASAAEAVRSVASEVEVIYRRWRDRRAPKP